jgi:hypothetical protein
MLRLPATKIDLGSRDLVWHIDRYQQRKIRYEQNSVSQVQSLGIHTRGPLNRTITAKELPTQANPSGPSRWLAMPWYLRSLFP